MIIEKAIEELCLPTGSRGLDVGCGIGLPTLQLARAGGPAGHITGLDLSHALIVRAKEIVEEHALSGRISFQEGDMNRLPFDDDSFDLAWSMDCVGYHPSDPLLPLKELARVVRSGGIVAILTYSSQQLLPGHPLLEFRLNATSAGITPFVHGKRPNAFSAFHA